ncbi:Lipoma HMGIC fusion partner-like [Oopsacas minuta]|uniref:Lipoma HMGIC fusion partner-like n=1 Tax=Oopsacas minuta TaxID=111878 RepID=A0AAV7K8H9_9METZ|nr:Lipoma HMGIC fusion partner-like [Oopsacas minuta]
MCRCNTYNCCAYLWTCLSIISTLICLLGFYLPVWMEVRNPYLEDGETNPVILSAYRVCYYPELTNRSGGEREYSTLNPEYNPCVLERDQNTNSTFYLKESKCPSGVLGTFTDRSHGCNYMVSPPSYPLYHIYCGRLISFDSILAIEWKAATLLMGVGSCCLVVTAFISLFGCCIRKLFNICLTLVVAVVQMLGSLCFVAAIILFPVGLRSTTVQTLCSFETCTADIFKLGICTFGWAYYFTAVGTFLSLISAILSMTTACHKDRSKEEIPYTI